MASTGFSWIRTSGVASAGRRVVDHELLAARGGHRGLGAVDGGVGREVEPEALEAAIRLRGGAVVDDDHVRGEPDDRAVGFEDVGGAFVGRVVEVGGVAEGVGVAGLDADGEDGRVAGGDVFPLRAAGVELGAVVGRDVGEGRVVLEGEGVLLVGAWEIPVVAGVVVAVLATVADQTLWSAIRRCGRRRRSCRRRPGGRCRSSRGCR